MLQRPSSSFPMAKSDIPIENPSTAYLNRISNILLPLNYKANWSAGRKRNEGKTTYTAKSINKWIVARIGHGQPIGT